MTDAPLALERVDDLEIDARGRLAQMYQLSPFVWRSAERYELMLRAVPRRDDDPALKIAEAWWGWSDDGRRFTTDRAPCLYPSPDGPDRDGCEDPTVLLTDEGLHVWYSGWNAEEGVGRLLHATGPSPDRLEKRGVALDSSDVFANPKEAELWRTLSGEWALAFEFARDGRSMIGVARSASLDGPWREPAVLMRPREGAWDCQHLSPGPILRDPQGRPVMLYNGASDGPRWRIGWARFSADLDRVEARGEDCLIDPGELCDGWTDIAFAASAVPTEGGVALYYSVADRALKRAVLRWR